MNAPELSSIVFRAATETDLPAIADLLNACDLPAQDLTGSSLSGFELAFAADGRLVGQAGLEIFGDAGLLRSLAVASAWRGRGIADQLVARREAEARRVGLTALYLLTTSAAEYFRRRAYADLPREAVPAAIATHPQFRGLCPSSAVSLRKLL